MKTITGKVVSNKMTKTVVVEITYTLAHPLYSKRIKKSNKVHAHDEMGAKIGDWVTLVETKPISKTKNWKVTDINRAEKKI